MSLFAALFDPSGLTPHGFCLIWNPWLMALQAGSDAIVALSYYSIPLAIAWFVHRRQDIAYRWLIYLFAAFILACGTTHWMAIVTLWVPAYWLEGIVKAITALLSLTTAILLWPLIPRALAVPSPAALRDVNIQLSLRIAENERAGRLLRESEARYRGIYNKTPVPLHTLDIEGRLNGTSDYWCDLLGYAREEVIGRPLADFCPLETADRLRQQLELLLAGGELRDVGCSFRKRDGSFIDALLSARVERDGLDRPLHILGVLTDVTGRRQAERALRASEERLLQAQKMEAIGKLTGGIAHDFNNMLTVIDGNLEMLRPRLAEDAESLVLTDAAARASLRAGKLTAQLLAFSRRQRLDPKPLDPARVIEGMITLLASSVGEQTELAIDIQDDDPWPCLADQNQLEAALLNLVINGSHAIAGQGEIRIQVANSALPDGDASWLDGSNEEAAAAGDYVRISVADDGCGMSEEVRARALEPFFTTKPLGEGTGLGLSQTYGFVRQSGGAMRIRSRPGVGTIVELLLPRAKCSQAALPHSLQPQRQDPLSRANRDAAQETLLIVEDEAEVLEIVAASLRADGYAVVGATDGHAALAALRSNPKISLIFTDIVMPGINGVTLAEEARRLRPGIPVVFASGYSDETVSEQLPKGAVFLQKPYRIGSVTKLIGTALAAQRMPMTQQA